MRSDTSEVMHARACVHECVRGIACVRACVWCVRARVFVCLFVVEGGIAVVRLLANVIDAE